MMTKHQSHDNLLATDRVPSIQTETKAKALHSTSMHMKNFIRTALLIACLLSTTTLVAQDAISVVAGRAPRGKIESTKPDKLIVATDDGTIEVDAWNVKRIRFEGEPNEVTAAKTAYSDERYEACVQSLSAMTKAPERKLLQQEIAFFKASAQAKIALAGGNISLNKAVTDIRAFIESNPSSFHVNQAVDSLGDLAMAMGRFDQATAQYEKTMTSQWPELRFNGQLKLGKAQLLDDELDAAINSFRATEASDNQEDYAVQAKLMARCLRAKALGLTGKATEGEQLVMAIIKNESSKDMALFANAYNALGTCYMNSGRDKEAIRAFLKTDLLFFIEPDSHAEALYQLNTLWTKIEQPVRATRSRQKMTQRYRNTFWASKLNQQ